MRRRVLHSDLTIAFALTISLAGTSAKPVARRWRRLAVD
jgi:hypothetical protein